MHELSKRLWDLYFPSGICNKKDVDSIITTWLEEKAKEILDKTSGSDFMRNKIWLSLGLTVKEEVKEEYPPIPECVSLHSKKPKDELTEQKWGWPKETKECEYEQIKYECSCGNRVEVQAESRNYFFQKQVICIKCSKQMYMNWTPRPKIAEKTLAEKIRDWSLVVNLGGYLIDEKSAKEISEIAEQHFTQLAEGKGR